MRIHIEYTLSEEGRRAALLAGRPAQASQAIEVDTDDLSVLDLPGVSVDDQGTGRLMPDTYSGQPHDAGWAVRRALHDRDAPLPAELPDILALLRTAAAEWQAAADKDAADEKHKEAERHEADLAALRTALAAGTIVHLAGYRDDAISVGTRGSCRGHYSIPDFPEIAEDLARAATAEQEAYAAAKARAAEAKAAEAKAQEDYRAAMLREHGAPDQIARADAGLLPAGEIDRLIADVLFEPSVVIARYRPIVHADLDHDDECECDTSSYSSHAMDQVTAEVWTRMEEIRALLPSATLTPREHTGRCDADDCEGYCTRIGIRVDVDAGPRRIHREYALD